MYNRYIRDQQGGFTRIREEDAPAEDSPYSCGPPPPPGPPSFGGADIGFLRRLLGKLGMADRRPAASADPVSPVHRRRE